MCFFKLEQDMLRSRSVCTVSRRWLPLRLADGPRPRCVKRTRRGTGPGEKKKKKKMLEIYDGTIYFYIDHLGWWERWEWTRKKDGVLSWRKAIGKSVFRARTHTQACLVSYLILCFILLFIFFSGTQPLDLPEAKLADYSFLVLFPPLAYFESI